MIFLIRKTGFNRGIKDYCYTKPKITGSLGIAPTRNFTHFLKIEFVVAGDGFIPIISTKGINQKKKEKVKFYAYKKI